MLLWAPRTVLSILSILCHQENSGLRGHMDTLPSSHRLKAGRKTIVLNSMPKYLHKNLNSKGRITSISANWLKYYALPSTGKARIIEAYTVTCSNKIMNQISTQITRNQKLHYHYPQNPKNNGKTKEFNCIGRQGSKSRHVFQCLKTVKPEYR